MTFRRGTKADEWPIRARLAQQLMNPLNIACENFVVAEDQGRRVGFAQIKDIGVSELASVFVEPEFRGRGLGTKLVRRALDDRAGDVYLLTLKTTTAWYRRFGFEETEPPDPLAFEVNAGKIITTLIGDDLVCMVLRR